MCDLSADAIIGTDTLGSILPHTLDIKKGLLFTDGGVSLQLHRRDAALHDPDSGRPVVFNERPVGGTDGVCREYRLSSGPDIGGSVRMESSSAGVQFQPRNRDGGTFFGGWHDCSGVGYSTGDG